MNKIVKKLAHILSNIHWWHRPSQSYASIIHAEHPICHYKLDQITDTTTDSSGNGYDAHIVTQEPAQ